MSRHTLQDFKPGTAKYKQYYDTYWISCEEVALYKKWSFPFRIFSVNVTNSAGNCGFGYIYWRNP